MVLSANNLIGNHRLTKFIKNISYSIASTYDVKCNVGMGVAKRILVRKQSKPLEMKTNATIQTPFFFSPAMSFHGHCPKVRQAKPRRRALGLAMETQIDYRPELVCGVIMILCLLFGLAASVAQFAA